MPAEVRPVFEERLAAAFPDRAKHVMNQVRDELDVFSDPGVERETVVGD